VTAAAPALGPKEAAALLLGTARMIEAEVSAMSPALAAWHPAPGEWCVKEVLGHLIEADERGFAGRIRTIFGGPEPSLPGWDQEEVARARRDCERDAQALLREFAAARQAGAALAAGLSGEDLERAGLHAQVGRLRVRDLLHEWVHHDREHVKQMLGNVQAFAWPHMGNAQRFSTE
jgi:hypothetical protein